MNNESIARGYLGAIERGDAGEKLRRFFTPDFRQIEYPNRLNPKGQESDLASALRRSEQGTKVLRSQRYAIHNVVSQGDNVALEVNWTGVLAISVAGLSPGSEMRAHFAMFLEFDGGKIKRQRNYDCFEPW